MSCVAGGSIGKFAVKGDGHVFVAPDAIFDGFGIFLCMDERFPRVNVPGFVEIAVGDERQPL